MDTDKIRAEFPILNQKLYNRDFVYLDNGATSQTPNIVVDAIANYYRTINSNVHRGIHTLSQRATEAMEESRAKIQKHLNAKHESEVIFTKGTTDSINIIAHAMRFVLKPGDEVVVSALEHHSNLVPWQMLCQISGATLKHIPINNLGELEMDEYQKLLNKNTKLVAVNHISNALGTVNPIKEIAQMAHKYGALVAIDGAQAIPHTKVDVQSLDVDFYSFSGHKAYGPTGVGILYGKIDLLNEMHPYQGGGEMISSVTLEKSTYAKAPFRFEAGTPNIAGNIALGYAIDFMNSIGLENIASHEKQLLDYATQEIKKIEGIKIFGESKNKAGVLSFNLQGAHPSDVGSILDKLGIAVRTGQHCTQPIMDYFNIPGTVRASFAVYNTKHEVDLLIEGLHRVKKMLG